VPKQLLGCTRKLGIHMVIVSLFLIFSVQTAQAEDELQLVFGVYTTDKRWRG